MNTYETILKRRSIRSFTADAVPEGEIQALLEAAMAAPSARNKQPWEFYVLQNASLREKLRQVSPNMDREAPLIIVVAGNAARFLGHGSDDFWVQDCAAAVENILLAATERGIASCWCGLYPVTERAAAVRSLLGLDETIIPMALVQLGYSAETPVPRTQYDETKIHVLR